MTPSPDRRVRLAQMQEARRQTQRQLDMIERRIRHRMTALLPDQCRRQAVYRRGRPPAARPFLDRYRQHLVALIAERQPEVDALSRKLARQDAAISGLFGCDDPVAGTVSSPLECVGDVQ